MSSLERSTLENVTVLKLRGSLAGGDIEQVEKPFEEATRRPGARVVVDLSGVEIVTTPALSMFLAAAQASKQSGGRIVFTESQPPVRDVLRRLRLHSVLETAAGLEQAISMARK